MTTAAAIGLTLDGHLYTVEDVTHVGPEYERVTCQVPDEQWTATDSHGHEHRYWQPAAGGDLALPTLARNTRHVECDGYDALHPVDEPCEGYDETYWACIVCGDEVTPGSRHGSCSFKSREGYTVVTTSIDPAELADSNGYITIPSKPAHHDDAHLVWPAGPGQMLDVRGTAWEIGDSSDTWIVGGRPARMTQRWAVSEAREALGAEEQP